MRVPPLDLTPAGRPILRDEEHLLSELHEISAIKFDESYSCSIGSESLRGKVAASSSVRVTDKRLLLTIHRPSLAPLGLALPLAALSSISIRKSTFTLKPKIQIDWFVSYADTPATRGKEDSFRFETWKLYAANVSDMERFVREVQQQLVLMTEEGKSSVSFSSRSSSGTMATAPPPSLPPPHPSSMPSFTSNPLLHPASTIPSIQNLHLHHVPSAPLLTGISGLVKRREEERKLETATLTSSFSDLDSLMQNAAKLSLLASKLNANLKRIRREGGSSSAASSSSSHPTPMAEREAAMERNEQEVATLLADLGILNPTTRETAGRAFHLELARELADFVLTPRSTSSSSSESLLSKHRVLPLADLYCLFNRARATSLISPDDLLRACQLASTELSVDLVLREFPSGVRVLETKESSDEQIMKRLEQLVNEEEGGVSATQVANWLSCPVLIAREYLLLGERNQLLARDEGPQGLIFYRNLFFV